MNIYKNVFVIFAILIVQLACNPISEEEETKIGSVEKYLALDANSTYKESVIPDNYQSLNKRNLEPEPSYQKETTNEKSTSEPEYSYFSQRHKRTYSKADLSVDENQPKHDEKSDSVATEEIEATRNIKHQSRSLKEYKTKDNEGHEISSSEKKADSSNNKHENLLTKLGIGLKSWEKFTSEKNYLSDFIKNLNLNERSIQEQIFRILENTYGKELVDSSNNEHEKPLTNSDLGIGLKSWEKFTSEKNYLRDFIKNLNLNERSIREQIFKILETNYGKEPVPGIPMGENGFRILIELKINPFNLDKPVSSLFMERLHKIYNEIITLIGIDIQSNIFPLVFHQTVSPSIKEKLLPLLQVPSLKQEIAIFDKDYKFPVLFTILRDLIEIPEDLEKDDYTISNIFKILDEELKKLVINDIQGNKILVKLYKRNVERIQELLDEDWKENEAPVNFIKYITDYFRSEKFLIIGRFLNQMLTQKLKGNDRLQENVESVQKSLESSLEDEL